MRTREETGRSVSWQLVSRGRRDDSQGREQHRPDGRSTDLMGGAPT